MRNIALNPTSIALFHCEGRCSPHLPASWQRGGAHNLTPATQCTQGGCSHPTLSSHNAWQRPSPEMLIIMTAVARWKSQAVAAGLPRHRHSPVELAIVAAHPHGISPLCAPTAARGAAGGRGGMRAWAPSLASSILAAICASASDAILPATSTCAFKPHWAAP